MNREVLLKRIILLISLFFFLIPTLSFSRQTPVQIFDRALELSREGSPKESVDLLFQLVEEHPDFSKAAQALYQAGIISERKLEDFDRAKIAYNRAIENYPSNSWSKRAQKRLTVLLAATRKGGEALILFNKAMKNIPKIGVPKTMEIMKSIFEKYPDFSKRDQVGFWIGDTLARGGENLEAVKYFKQIIEKYPGSNWSFLGLEKLGNAYVALGRFDDAIHIFEMMAPYADKHPGAGARSEQLVEKTKEAMEAKIPFNTPALTVEISDDDKMGKATQPDETTDKTEDDNLPQECCGCF